MASTPHRPPPSRPSPSSGRPGRRRRLLPCRLRPGPDSPARSQAPTTGFRGFTLSLVASQPATVDALIGAALDAGATRDQAGQEELLGLRRRRCAPDGTIWKVATSEKKDTGPATRQVDDIVLLLGVADVSASKQFYVGRGLVVAQSFGRKYVEFDAPAGTVKFALYGRRPWPGTPGSPRRAPDRTGSSITGAAGPFTDPDGFAWARHTQLTRTAVTTGEGSLSWLSRTTPCNTSRGRRRLAASRPRCSPARSGPR